MKTQIKGGLVLWLIFALVFSNISVVQAEEDTVSSSTDSPAGPIIDSDGITTWDCIYFGSYWNRDTNGDGKADTKDDKEPIKWRVLSVNGTDAFLMADRGLDMTGSLSHSQHLWRDCECRKWLNEDFYNAAFTEDEKAAIQTTKVSGGDSTESEENTDTEDKVYLLSVDEVTNSSYGFSESKEKSETRIAYNTAYTKEQTGKLEGNWLLRHTGENSFMGVVKSGGLVYEASSVTLTSSFVLRPVLHMDLSSDVWSNAGTVKAGEKAIGDVRIRSPRVDSEKGTVTYDCVYFGNYWQDDTNEDGVADENDEKEPIKWRVLSVEGEDVFLLADKGLDSVPFNATGTAGADTEAVWETSTLREWLNSDFCDEAFTEEEDSSIRTTQVETKSYGTEGEETETETEDKVYLLSDSEMMNLSYGFPSFVGKSEARAVEYTSYAEQKAGGTWSVGACWLRSPVLYGKGTSGINTGAMEAYKNGRVDQNVGLDPRWDSEVVRPVLHINLSDLQWTRAESVQCSLVGQGEEFQTTSALQLAADEEIHNPQTDEDGNTVWDCIYFGNYYQNNFLSKEPIRWRVLQVNGNDAFLMADKSLDSRQYHGDALNMNTTWESSTLRTWLNEDFYQTAFSEDEQSAIITTDVVTAVNPEYETDGGNATKDKIYLLSYEEVINPLYGFSESGEKSDTRCSANTVFAGQQKSSVNNPSYWLLRTPGKTLSTVSYVGEDGAVDTKKWLPVSDSSFSMVRPVLHLDLSSSVWKKATRVNSLGVYEEPEPTATTEPTEPDTEPEPANEPTTEPDITDTTAPTTEPGITTTTAPTTEPDITTTTAPTTEPTATVSPITGLKGVCTTGNKVKLTWNRHADGKQYEIFRSVKKDGKYKKIAKISGTKIAYTDKTVKKGKDYYYKVIPVDKTGLVGELAGGNVVKVSTYALDTPVIQVKKSRTAEGQNYILIELKKYEGTYADIYVKYKGKYHKLKIKKKTISSYRGQYRLRFQSGGHTMKFKVRTYRIKKGKRQYSNVSKVKQIKA